MGIFDKLFGRKKVNEIEYFCAKCDIQLDTEMMEMVYGGFGKVAGIVRPGSSQYAGKCPQCGNLYCARCASFSGVTFQCPNCNSGLEAALHG